MIRCVLECSTKEILEHSEKLALELTKPDRVYEDVAVSYPGGIEKRFYNYYRIEDHFSNIGISIKDNTLTLVFNPIKKMNFWKDIVVNTIDDIMNNEGVKVILFQQS